MILRPYQEQNVEDIRQAIRSGVRRILYVLGTGGGKTVIFSHLVKSAAAKGNKVCIIVHRKELMKQITEALDYDCGCIKSGMRERDHPIQIALVGTLANRIKKKDYRFNFIVIDEAHHAKASQYMKIIEAFPNAIVLGVTATPVRLDGKGLGDIFQTMIHGPSVEYLTANGFLAPAAIYAPEIPISVAGVRTVHGDFDKSGLLEVMGSPKITGDTIQTYRKLADGLPTIVSCCNIAHSKLVTAEFVSAGYNAVHVDGKTPERQRVAALEGLADGSVHQVSNCDLFGEGVDVPVVGCCIFLRHTKSVSLYLQQVGRGLRPSPGKKEVVIIDQVGNVLRHGLPNQDRNWQLEMDKKKRKQMEEEVRIQQCRECFGVHKPAPVCPYCGHVHEVAETGSIAYADGELVRVDEARLKVIHCNQIRQARSKESLQEIAKERGYSPGWVYKIMRSREKKKGVKAS